MNDQPPDSAHQDVHLDCIGLRCPLPVLRARKALRALRPGQVLRVESTDPMAVLDIPPLARAEGHEVIATQVEGARASFRIRRGPEQSS